MSNIDFSESNLEEIAGFLDIATSNNESWKSLESIPSPGLSHLALLPTDDFHASHIPKACKWTASTIQHHLNVISTINALLNVF